MRLPRDWETQGYIPYSIRGSGVETRYDWDGGGGAVGFRIQHRACAPDAPCVRVTTCESRATSPRPQSVNRAAHTRVHALLQKDKVGFSGPATQHT